jgi:hypothetical protein
MRVSSTSSSLLRLTLRRATLMRDPQSDLFADTRAGDVGASADCCGTRVGCVDM